MSANKFQIKEWIVWDSEMCHFQTKTIRIVNVTNYYNN